MSDSLERIAVNLLYSVMAVLAELKGKVSRIEIQGNRIMAAIDDINALLKAMDTATNDVAARLQALVDQLAGAAGGVAAQDVPAITAALQAEITRLQGLAADPANPVPQ